MKEVVIKNAPYRSAPENDYKAKPNYLVSPLTPLENLPQEHMRIIKLLETLVQVTIPLLVAFGEELIEVHEHVPVHVLQIVVCLQCNKYFESISNKRQ